MVNLFETIRGRRSIRSFEKHNVPMDYIYKILDAARYAPSAGNLQPWEFVIVDDEPTKQKIAEACLGQSFISNAPIVIVACADTERSGSKYGARGKAFYSVCEVSAAVENMMLAAEAFGLGTCWVGAFDENKLKYYLKLPKAVVPIAVVPVGYPLSKPSMHKKVELSNILHFGEYGRYKRIESKGIEPNPKVEHKPAPKQEAKPAVKRKKGLIDVFR